MLGTFKFSHEDRKSLFFGPPAFGENLKLYGLSFFYSLLIFFQNLFVGRVAQSV